MDRWTGDVLPVGITQENPVTTPQEEVKIEKVLDELIEELVDIEEYILSDRPIPKAHRYRYRVNKTKFVSEHAELTREQILERAGLVPVNQYRLSKKLRYGPPEEIKPGQTVHLRDHGIERFIAQHCEVQDGLGSDRREFTLSGEDTAFLNSLDWRWEAIKDGPNLWVVIYGVTVPPGYQVNSVDIAIQIAAGYPTAQLDMAYFYPTLARLDGKPISQADIFQPLDGKSWQRWSRHRLGSSVWIPGIDNLERHFIFVQDWLTREVGR